MSFLGIGSSNKEDNKGGSPYEQSKQAKKKKKKSIDFTPIAFRVARSIGEGLEKAARPHNLKRRKEFLKKQGLTSEDIRMDDDYLLSKEGLKELREIGYTTAGDIKPDRDGPSKKSIEQPLVASQMDNTDVKSKMITAKGPTEAETVKLAQLDEDERLLKIKRKGRKVTTLTNITGVEEKPTLSKKILLG